MTIHLPDSLSLKIAVIVLATATLILGGCALPKEPGYSLPLVADPSSAATVFVKSAHNPSDQQFAYLLLVDGQTIMEFRESDQATFKLDAGAHDFKVTCHVVPSEKIYGKSPPRMSVVDGSAEIQATLEGNGELCLTVGKSLANCARLEDSPMSLCRE